MLLVRPKTCLVDEGGYRESRYFAAWPAAGDAQTPQKQQLQQLQLPPAVVQVSGQQTAPFGEKTREEDIKSLNIEFKY